MKTTIFRLAAAIVFFPCAAFAHPHIFAEAHLEIVAGDDGTVSELRNVWRFDEVFSSSVLLDFDKNADNQLDHSELADVGAVVLDSMQEYDYFLNITQNGKNITVKKPSQMIADYKDGQLLLIFAAEPKVKMPLKGNMSFGVYDPTLYTAMDFPTDGDMMVEGKAFKKCTHKVVRPDPDEVISQNQSQLTEAFWNDPMGTDRSKLFATRIEIACGS
ncbi:DUF1007 family protein [Rhizobium sp. L1K21]|uniref:DUF1007 family protein n=1 Tax=Rhizobium sp. L1K21 TaxID=2954933 RepID=UPI002093F8A7|nr:DUF1007 family protein [Rhizobium sp. L1K21]MCO6186882.1 DUF1007 family protein [Rhizobium sp. L1K21]